MRTKPYLISKEGIYYQILEVLQGVVSIKRVGGSTIVAYKLIDLSTRFDLSSISLENLWEQ